MYSVNHDSTDTQLFGQKIIEIIKRETFIKLKPVFWFLSLFKYHNHNCVGKVLFCFGEILCLS